VPKKTDRRLKSEGSDYGYGRRPSLNRRTKRRQRKRKVMTLLSVMAGVALSGWAVVQVYHVAVRPASHPNHPNHPLSGVAVAQTKNTTGLSGNKTTSSPSSSGPNGRTTTASSHTGGATPVTKAPPSLPTKEQVLDKMTKDPLPASALIQVPAQSQLPQLNNGCEVTSLSMLLTYVKHPVSKMTLAQEEPRDETPLVMKDNKIVSWGNPNVGFVGSVAGTKKYGFGIYHGPLTKLVDDILPQRGLDLTGSPFDKLEAVVAGGTPVEVWTTFTFQPTNDWITWQTPEGPIRITMQEHAVLLVGFSQNYVYINNPWNGMAAQKVPLKPFVEGWDQLGKQAITVAPEQYVTS
jgi:uncharacterized protein YvpB